MPGYILLDLDKEEIPAKYMCSFCGFLLRDARQTPCGHVYCDECVVSLVIVNTFTCLKDGEQSPIHQVYPDNFVRREVLSLFVRCNNTESECKWRGEVRHVTNHTAECPYQKIKCDHPDCDVTLLRKDLPDHSLNECEYRVIPCTYCGIDVSLADMQKHGTTECVMVCPKCHTDGIPRGIMPIHLDPYWGECPELEGPCPFSTLGCPAKEVMNKERRAEHMKNDTHLNLLQKGNLDLVLACSEGMPEQIKLFVLKVESLVHENAKFKCTFAEQAMMINDLQRRQSILSNMVAELLSGSSSFQRPQAKMNIASDCPSGVD